MQQTTGPTQSTLRLVAEYVIAIGLVGAFVLARAALDPILKDVAPLVLFLVPVAIAAWFYGLGPGLAATVVGCVSGITLFAANPAAGGTLGEQVSFWITRSVPFCCVGAFISILSSHLERARQVAEQEKHAAQEARAVAEQASQLKDDFLATISHELRTPLSAIVGWSSLLQQQIHSRESSNGDGTASTAGDDELLREGLAVIRRNARAQSQLIEDILDVSRITSGKVRLDARRLDLRDAVEAALATVRTAAAAKGVTLDADLGDEPVTLSGDPDRLQQIFWNLLNNAIKFTPAGGNVRATLRTNADRAHVSVVDDGQGMDAAFVPHVFERFRQADMSTTRRQGGLGLGLAIVRQLTELHGGTVSAASDGLGKGSRFEVVLPALAANPRTASGIIDGVGKSTAVAASRRDAQILVVDDDADSRRMIEATLLSGGLSVTSVHSADAALAAIAGASGTHVNGRPGGFAAIISDIGMPDADGYALMRQIRSTEQSRGLPRVPALALTAFARETDRQQTLSAGFDSFLAKPTETDALLRAVNALLDRRGA